MHFCTAMIAIANDDQQVVYRGPFEPVSWPEIEVLRTIHGDEAVRNVKPFVFVEQTMKAEKERLGLIYGGVVSEKVWVGRNAHMELDAAEMTALDPGTPWLNPLTGAIETLPMDEEEIEIAEVADAEEDDPPVMGDPNAKPKRSHKKRVPSDDVEEVI
jgi:hypothetical protein